MVDVKPAFIDPAMEEQADLIFNVSYTYLSSTYLPKLIKTSWTYSMYVYVIFKL